MLKFPQRSGQFWDTMAVEFGGCIRTLKLARQLPFSCPLSTRLLSEVARRCDAAPLVSRLDYKLAGRHFRRRTRAIVEY